MERDYVVEQVRGDGEILSQVVSSQVSTNLAYEMVVCVTNLNFTCYCQYSKSFH